MLFFKNYFVDLKKAEILGSRFFDIYRTIEEIFKSTLLFLDLFSVQIILSYSFCDAKTTFCIYCTQNQVKMHTNGSFVCIKVISKTNLGHFCQKNLDPEHIFRNCDFCSV